MRKVPSGLPATMAVLLLLLALPGVAAACSLCMDSMIYSTFPWLPFAFVALVLWISTDFAIRKLAEGPGIFDATISPTFWAVIIFPVPALCIAGWLGVGILIILMGSYIFYRLVREIIGPRCELPRLSRVISVSTLTVVLLIALIGVWKRANMTDLEVYDRYTLSGTGPARLRARSLASDPDFDIELLRPMIESMDKGRSSKAFMVLHERGKTEDLIEFANLVLPHLPTTQSARGLLSDDTYLSLWLQSLGLDDVETRADLEKWLKSIGDPTSHETVPPNEERRTQNQERSD